MTTNNNPRPDLTRANRILDELTSQGLNDYFLTLIGALEKQCRTVQGENKQIRALANLKEVAGLLFPAPAGPITAGGGRLLPPLGKLDTIVGRMEEVQSSLELSIDYLSQTLQLVSASIEQGKTMVAGMLELVTRQKVEPDTSAVPAGPPLAPPDPPFPSELPASGFEYPPPAPSKSEIPIDFRKRAGGELELTFIVNGRQYYRIHAECKKANYFFLPDRGTLVRICGWYEVFPAKPAKLEVAREGVVMASCLKEVLVDDRTTVRFHYQGIEYMIEAKDQNLVILLPDAEGTLLAPSTWNAQTNLRSEDLKVVAAMGKVVMAFPG